MRIRLMSFRYGPQLVAATAPHPTLPDPSRTQYPVCFYRWLQNRFTIVDFAFLSQLAYWPGPANRSAPSSHVGGAGYLMADWSRAAFWELSVEPKLVHSVGTATSLTRLFDTG